MAHRSCRFLLNALGICSCEWLNKWDNKVIKSEILQIKHGVQHALPLFYAASSCLFLVKGRILFWAQCFSIWHVESRRSVLSLRLDMSTYCCTQFVVSRKRLEGVPDAFWSIPTARKGFALICWCVFFFLRLEVVEGKRTSVDLLRKKIRCGLALLASTSQCRGD